MFGRKDAPAQAPVARGDAARDRRAWAEAASAYQTALKANPDLAHIWVQYGHVLKEDGRVGEAVDAYREAAKRRPDHAETQVHLAHALKRLGLHEDAVDAFETALALDPADEDAAEELFALQRRLNPAPDAPRPDGTVPPSPRTYPEMQAALLKEREINAAAELRLSALQMEHLEAQAENDVLKEQVRGQQDEIEKYREHEAAYDEMIAMRAALLGDVEALREQVRGQQDEIEDQRNQYEERLKASAAANDALREERDAARAEAEALRARMQDINLRADLAKKEFLRSEGQIALIKDMFLHEGGL